VGFDKLRMQPELHEHVNECKSEVKMKCCQEREYGHGGDKNEKKQAKLCKSN